MESVVKIASYVSERYKNIYKVRIDEMKLHKILYFIQRESLIQTGKPMFHEQFYAWKYGPVLKEIRWAYRFDMLDQKLSNSFILENKPIFDKVFVQYAQKSSWSLSRLSHGEYSWQNARKGLAPIAVCENAISLNDIKEDAKRIKLRRFFVEQMSNID